MQTMTGNFMNGENIRTVRQKVVVNHVSVRLGYPASQTMPEPRWLPPNTGQLHKPARWCGGAVKFKKIRLH
jgi:hypothetical protein